MYITYHGHCCFSIKGKTVTLLTDPYDSSLGISLPKELSANIVTISHDGDDFASKEAIKDVPHVLDWAGEYEIEDVSIRGILSFRNTKEEEYRGENIIFVFDFEGVRFCHLGSLGCKLPDDQLEKIGNIDVLMIPIGGNGSIDAKKAVEVVEQIDPRVVIPMRYAVEGIKTELLPINDFARMMGHESFETAEKWMVNNTQLPEESTEFIVLEAIHE